MKRVVSNLIDNAVEALSGKGCVVVNLEGRPDKCVVRVVDDGCGMPPEVLRSIGQRGATHGKVGGNGLGLYHAQTMVQSWGGHLQIESVGGAGTTMVIELPRSKPPAWFVEELVLPTDRPVVVV